MKESNRTKSLLAIGLTVVLAAPLFANAANEGYAFEDTSIRVSFSDLDLSSTSGVEALYMRLKAASEEACGPTNYREAGTLRQLVQNKACYDEALSKAVSKVNNADLDELHSS